MAVLSVLDIKAHRFFTCCFEVKKSIFLCKSSATMKAIRVCPAWPRDGREYSWFRCAENC